MQSFKITIDNRDFVVVCLPNRPKALLDRTVAEIYEIETKQINQAVKRNPEKFPEDFCFELTSEEFDRLHEIENYYLKDELVTNCDQFKMLKHSSVLPKAFTHLGCNMLATILKSPAVQRAIQIIRTFTALESGGYDRKFEEVLNRLDKLETRPENIEKKHDKLEANFHFLLWEGQSETSPILQIQKQIHNLEERIETLFMDGRFRRLQLGEIYKDIVRLREYIEKELENVGAENFQPVRTAKRRTLLFDKNFHVRKSFHVRKGEETLFTKSTAPGGLFSGKDLEGPGRRAQGAGPQKNQRRPQKNHGTLAGF